MEEKSGAKYGCQAVSHGLALWRLPVGSADRPPLCRFHFPASPASNGDGEIFAPCPE